MGGTVERVGVVGGGLMGAGIAEVCARAGVDVHVVEADDTAAAAARERIERSLGRAVDRGKLDATERDAALARLVTSTDLEALADRDLVIEAIVESLEAKHGAFATLDRVLGDGAVLATNTSSLPIQQVAAATGRPEWVVGLHFFNPAPVQPLVEVIPSLSTSDACADRAEAFARDQLGKTTIRCADRAGFVVNALLVPYLLSAIRMLETGHATAEDIDTGMVYGTAHPMGPIALTDLVGLDTTLSVAEALYEEFADPACAPPPLLRRMVEAGRLGKKAGRGFYDYR